MSRDPNARNPTALGVMRMASAHVLTRSSTRAGILPVVKAPAFAAVARANSRERAKLSPRSRRVGISLYSLDDRLETLKFRSRPYPELIRCIVLSTEKDGVEPRALSGDHVAFAVADIQRI